MGNILKKDPPAGQEEAPPVLEIPKEQTMTIFPVEDFNAVQDAENLNKAFQDFLTNEDGITAILANRSWEQRQQIRDTYQTKYQKTVMSEFDGVISTNYQNVVEGLLSSPETYRANYINKIIADRLLTHLPQNRGKDVALLEVIFPLTKTELNSLRIAYGKAFKNSLAKDIEEKVTGKFAQVVLSVVKNGRNEGMPVGAGVAKDVSMMKNLTGDQWTTEHKELFDLIAKQNTFYLFSIFNTYQLETGTNLTEVIEKQVGAEFKEGFKVLVESCLDVYQFYADGLYTAMKGFGTNDEKLIYIILDRCEMDLGNIRVAFEIKYKKSLVEFVKCDTSGDYKNILVAIIEDPKLKA